VGILAGHLGTGLELRPLSLGEILDRSFSLYRRNFLLFLGITGLPQLPVLALRLVQTRLMPLGESSSLQATSLYFALAGVVYLIAIVAYVFAQGGTILAVSDLYLGRGTTIQASLRSVLHNVGYLFGAIVLSFLCIGAGMVFLLIPGIYVACRLLVCLPAALLERKDPTACLSRSFELTRDQAGRAFVILVLSIVLAAGIELLMAGPFGIAAVFAAENGSVMRIWLALAQLGESLANVLVSPILLIATSIFYFDLRVRKEAFDLQFMMDPQVIAPSGSPLVPPMYS
jgi:hypothetical protein